MTACRPVRRTTRFSTNAGAHTKREKSGEFRYPSWNDALPLVQMQPVEFLEWVERDLTYAMDFHDSWLTNGAGRIFGRFREM